MNRYQFDNILSITKVAILVKRKNDSDIRISEEQLQNWIHVPDKVLMKAITAWVEGYQGIALEDYLAKLFGTTHESKL